LRKLDNGNELRINALSGYGQDSDRRRSAAAGFDAHLVKPVEMDALERMLAMGPGGPPPERPPAPARGRYNPAP
jgi:CheY-like chemotaxis protein